MKKGDRIELLSMPQDPDPIPTGTKGTITFVSEIRSMGFTQVGVKWDNGRSLMLSVPPDQFRILENDHAPA